MPSNGVPSSHLAITVSAVTGRSYHCTHALPAGTCLLDVATPYTCTVYKQFRNEVCAECWRYDGGRRGFLACRNFMEGAGLLFCDASCRDAWIEREGHVMAELLRTLETVRQKHANGKENATDTLEGLTTQQIEQAWDDIDRQQKNIKTVRRWKNVHLDDFEMDQARYVLMALCHYAQETLATTPALIMDMRCATATLPFGCRWADFACLQSGELHQVTKFPELLSNHVRIFEVLKAHFGAYPADGKSSILRRLADVVRITNVRTALGVDPGNSFGIWEVPVTAESEGLGFGVYPVPSFFNHRAWAFSGLWRASC